MANKIFRRTVILAIVVITALLMINSSAYATGDNARYLMDAVTMSNGNIAVLFMKNSSSSGSLYLGVYNPTNNDWNEVPVGETAPTAKEAALDVHDNKAHVVYVTEEDNINYFYQTETGWSDVTTFSSLNANGSWVSTDALSCPDIVVDNNGTVHISYIDTDGAGDEDSRQADGMYATNASGSFIITAPVSCTGYREAYGMITDSIVKPLKLSVGENGRNLQD